ncbi:MAG: formylglycine-generating enzyme family protein [Bacteroidia bacterium]
MKLFYSIFLFFILVAFQQTNGQTISKVFAERNQGGSLSISYNLEDARDRVCKYFIQVYYQDVNAKWVEITEDVTGDLGMNQIAGFKKSIKWNPFLKNNFNELGESQIKITATPMTYKDFILVGGYKTKIKKEDVDTLIYIKPFYISKFEVTVKEFEEFVANSSYKTDAENGSFSYIISNEGQLSQTDMVNWRFDPRGKELLTSEYGRSVVFISPNDAEEYARFKNCRLPTEFEWEAAATCNGSFQLNPAALDSMIFFNPNVKKRLNTTVGSMKSNPLGLYDMYGNVWEIVRSNSFQLDNKYFQKGGSFNSEPGEISIQYSGGIVNKYAFGDIGFRIVKDISY